MKSVPHYLHQRFDFSFSSLRLLILSENGPFLFAQQSINQQDNVSTIFSPTRKPDQWMGWFNGWFLLLLLVLLLAIGYGFVRTYLGRQAVRQRQEIEATKTRLFTNITHEFSTPLTSILQQIETLKQRLRRDEDQLLLDLINQQATELMSLVRRLVDLSKVDTQSLTLNESQRDLVGFLQRLVATHTTQALAKGIQLSFDAGTMHAQYWFDADLLERIVSNLIVNSLKFTPTGGKISIDIRAIPGPEPTGRSDASTAYPSWCQLIISDNGIGILPEKLPFIFDRFHQDESADYEWAMPTYSGYSSRKGVGIGLALVKELVEFQSGSIRVDSKVSLGTTFTIVLPYKSAMPNPDTALIGTTESETGQQPIPDEIAPAKAPVILVVEDNAALRDYYTGCLPSRCRVHQATNGQEGLEQAINIMPDLVISDILTPDLDGYTLCEQLKTDSRTSHIPVLLLAAQPTASLPQTSYNPSADDYLPKPFQAHDFQLRIRNILEQQRHLQEWVLASLTNPDPMVEAPAPADPFIEKIGQIIEHHLDEASFGVEELIQASGMSRMNLHRKLKALTDTSTGEFLRHYRLKRAAQFLRQGRTVSETAYLVGFEDPSYFARSFRKVYKMAPSAFSRIDETNP